jgi:putative heme-binding domain-containing protein
MLKWIADERLTQFTSLVEQRLDSAELTPTTLAASLSCMEMLQHGEVSPKGSESLHLFGLIADDRRSPQLRAYVLRMLRTDAPHLTADFLKGLLAQPDARLKLEAVQKATVLATSDCRRLLGTVASDAGADSALRAWAIDGLAGEAEYKSELINWAVQSSSPIRGAALRALVGVDLSKPDLEQISKIGDLPGVARILKHPAPSRPAVEDLDAWLKLTGDKQGDADHGRHIFFHPTVGACSRCHSAEGRGNTVGPNLSHIGRTPRPQLLQSILQPSRDVAPGFRQWRIETSDGRSRHGIALRKGGQNEDYLGDDGREFSLPTADIVAREEISTSIMPDGLTAQLTDQEIADLLAFLAGQM